MTPTLLGRWQTRLLLLSTIGFVLTVPFLFFGLTPLINLVLVIAVGFLWDILWQFLTRLRWDRDWPPAYQLGAGIVEGVAIYLLDRLLRIPVALGVFLVHYSLVWLATFLASQSMMRVLFPRWRYRGGQVL
jgi:hypothetical protein